MVIQAMINHSFCFLSEKNFISKKVKSMTPSTNPISCTNKTAQTTRRYRKSARFTFTKSMCFDNFALLPFPVKT